MGFSDFSDELVHENEKLKEENQRLRKALEKVSSLGTGYAKEIARKALNGDD